MKATFKNAWPYQNDAMNLPVADVEAAVPFYEMVMGFSVESRRDEPHKAAVLARDGIRIGLAENGLPPPRQPKTATTPPQAGGELDLRRTGARLRSIISKRPTPSSRRMDLRPAATARGTRMELSRPRSTQKTRAKTSGRFSTSLRPTGFVTGSASGLTTPSAKASPPLLKPGGELADQPCSTVEQRRHRSGLHVVLKSMD